MTHECDRFVTHENGSNHECDRFVTHECDRFVCAVFQLLQTLDARLDRTRVSARRHAHRRRQIPQIQEQRVPRVLSAARPPLSLAHSRALPPGTMTHLLGELIKDKAFDTTNEAAARDHRVHGLFLLTKLGEGVNDDSKDDAASSSYMN